ncbi:MAG: hypothetical protein RLZZ533_1453 [Cyanobacteriota bacterium]
MPWAGALLSLLVLAGCSGAPSPDVGALPAATPPNSAPASPPAPAVAGAGFTPLPSPQQVLAALPVGRPDPFAPVLTSAQAAGPAPEGLRLTGVLRSRWGPQAFLQLAPGQGGAVCVGPRGLCAGSGLPALLPPGWSVLRIDVAQGRLLLNQGGQRRLLSL